jgi:hypothetical protein
MATMTAAAKWTRVCPGLYVDPSGKWIVSREGRGWYSVRELTGWGRLLDGVTMFPEYGDIWYGDYFSLADAKASVERERLAK